MTYIKIEGIEYPAAVSGRFQDRDWDGRESKSITLEMNHEQALALFQDKVAWSIVSRRDNGSETVEEEYDNSAFSIAGDVTDHRNGTVTVKMGALTEAEELMAFIEGGETQ